MKRSHFFISLFVIVLAFSACSDDEKNTNIFTDGVFIINEGSYGNNNGSLSFYSYSEDSVYNNVFEQVNGRKLGDVVQSAKINDDDIFIVVNNSNKVEVANKNSLAEEAVISGVGQPRYMVQYNGAGYISCWGDNSIKVVNLSSFSVSNSISLTTSGPDKMLVAGDKLYVANAGGWGNDSLVTVIDLTSNTVITNIDMPYNPCDLVMDKEGYIWVLSQGKSIYNADYTAIIAHTPSMLYKINSSTNTIIEEYELFAEDHPMHLEIDNTGTTLFIGGGYAFTGVYTLSVDAPSASPQKLCDDFAYGISYDNDTEVLFVTLGNYFTGAGTLNRYNQNGTLLGTYTCGIGPNGTSMKDTRDNY